MKTETKRVRVLSIKLDLQADQFKRLRDLSWQAAAYRNNYMRAKWAEALGWQTAEGQKDKPTKHIRATEKAELSGACYSACEREVTGAWQKDSKKIMSGGMPLPEWDHKSALAVRGHKSKSESGIRLEIEGGRYVAYLAAQAAICEGGSWLKLPVAENTRRDEYQSGVLNKMVSWELPILKAVVSIIPTRYRAILRLTYELCYPLPAMGERVATIGPIERDGRLHLRTETQRMDLTSMLVRMVDMKDRWDLIRRRAKCQIGWRKGHGRAKRKAIARTGYEDWRKTYLHQWTTKIRDWCLSQGVGVIRYGGLQTLDWPAYQFVQMLKYKAEDHGMAVEEHLDPAAAESSDRSAKAAIKKQQRKAKRKTEAIRTLQHQLAG